MYQGKFFSFQTILRIFAFLVLINLLFLDVIIFNGQKTKIIEKTVSVPIIPNVCPASCLSEMNQIAKETVGSVKAPVFTSLTLTKTSPTQAPTSFSVKEFFVPFGTGSNSTDDWQDVAGLRASLDASNYGSIKTVTFEASVRIPTGNETAYVRLYNVTDKHPVWFSDVSLDGGVAQLLISKPITLDLGNKTYQVQMKTSLKYPAFLDQSRIHIITN